MTTLLSYAEALSLVERSDRSFLGVQKASPEILRDLWQYRQAAWSYHPVEGGKLRTAYSRGEFLLYEA